MSPLIRKTISLFLAAVCAASICRAAPDYGLNFKSYDYAPSERTSLTIPQAKRKLVFSSRTDLSFDFRIDPARENFGYLCRVAIDEERGLDILLTSPVGGMPKLVATDSKSKLVTLETLNINEWQRASITISQTEGKDSLACSFNGEEILKLKCSNKKTHSIRILFGGNGMGPLATNDVAPLTLKDILLKVDSKHIYEWSMDGDNELMKYSPGLVPSVVNPDWIKHNYRIWKKLTEIKNPGKMFHAVDRENDIIFFICPGRLYRVRLSPELKIEDFSFSEDIQPGRLTNDFCVLPDGRLAYVGIEDDVQISCFDFDNSCWQESVRLKRHSAYSNHTSFTNPVDSMLVHIFGYGFHQYLNELHVISPDGEDSASVIDIPQRYMNAVGVSDSTAFLFGGKGNPMGIQELGAEIYNDLYEMDLRDYSVRYIRDVENPESEVASPDMIVDKDNGTLTGLFFCPNEYNTSLKLKRFHIEDGPMETIGDEIPFNFLDIESQSELHYSKGKDAYFAVTVTKEPDGVYAARIYSIKCPILPPEEPIKSHLWIYLAAGALMLATAAGLEAKRRRDIKSRRKNRYQVPISSLKDNSTGIHLLGNFKVIDAAGKDISSEFTPLMRQLLCMLILYTENHNSVSNAEMKEILWNDKSDESYFNNRGVQLKNLRTVLEKVDKTIGMSSENGNWSINMENCQCDYCSSLRLLMNFHEEDIDKESMDWLLTFTRKGALLSEMRYEWLDRFKSEYTEAAMSALYNAKNSIIARRNPEMRISLADNLLLFDSLDEEAIRAKCKALIDLKRSGTAKNVFNKFSEDYLNIMGENLGKSFNEFIKE